MALHPPLRFQVTFELIIKPHFGNTTAVYQPLKHAEHHLQSLTMSSSTIRNYRWSHMIDDRWPSLTTMNNYWICRLKDRRLPPRDAQDTQLGIRKEVAFVAEDQTASRLLNSYCWRMVGQWPWCRQLVFMADGWWFWELRVGHASLTIIYWLDDAEGGSIMTVVGGS